MSELQAYYDAFRTNYWASHDARECGCKGSGWALSEVDTWHRCPAHGHGVPHPDALEDALEDTLEAALEGGSSLDRAIAATLPAIVDEDDIPF